MKHINQQAQERARAVARALADHARDQWGIDAQVVGESVRLAGRRLRARFAEDAALRWIAGWLK